MKKILLLILLLPAFAMAQKKPLDHTVYDKWQTVGERLISNDGRWIVYNIDPQEGDGDLYIESSDKSTKQKIPRGYSAVITEDSRFVVFKIKPTFKDIRTAKINKKKSEDMPKDSAGIVELGKGIITKFDKIASFKTPAKGFGWVAFQKEREPEKKSKQGNKVTDSLKKQIDSLMILVNELRNAKSESGGLLRDNADSVFDNKNEPKGSDLILFNVLKSEKHIFRNTAGYDFDKAGNHFAFCDYRIGHDSVANGGVILFSLQRNTVDTILRSINEAKNFAFSEDGNRLAFVAESGKDKKALRKFYDLYLYHSGDYTAHKIVDRTSAGMPEKYSVSENGSVRFSENGERLFFGTAPIAAIKDTALKDIDLVNLDIWNYKDDYLQTQQLRELNDDLKKSFTAVYELSSNRMLQLGNKDLPVIIQTNDWNGEYFVAITDTGRRISSQWTGRTLKDVYFINVKTGNINLVKKNLDGNIYTSSTGKYILWYDNQKRSYFTNDGNQTRNISSGIKTPLYDELNDVPDYPRAYGVLGWHQGDSSVYIYDRYDVWKIDPLGKTSPVNISKTGRSTRNVYRYTKTDKDEKFLRNGQMMIFSVFNDRNKSAQIAETRLGNTLEFDILSAGNYSFGHPVKAKNANDILYTKESFVQSPDLYLFDGKEERITHTNPQQKEYNWGTAELFYWKTFDSKNATGIIYKPEDFDSTKKYPVIIYFYERLSDNLNKYVAPAPTPSRLNITFFVSRGYIVFTPDIAYTIGRPGQSAYNYIVSGAQALAKKKWIDAQNIGIQGQSWGGYQVSHLITRTNMFKAAWAGAPVANMFSAYGGIRWESGKNRQFQYEKTQSRIGATIWERPELYVENSPLFHLKNVKTPLVIMANDADGAVPWYQGIELFTAMRRLGKQVWMLNYNGEAHNLVERKNRKDISIREQQFFDWLLKGAKPPVWITKGVPAVDKGKDWGLELDNSK